MKEPEVSEVASLIARALNERDDEAALLEVKARVGELAGSFQPYPADFAGHV
jgi:glycine/serine hydroxymethyltransferase